MDLKKEINKRFQKNCFFLKKKAGIIIVILIGIAVLYFGLFESDEEKPGKAIKRSFCEFKPVRITGDLASPLELVLSADKLIWTDGRNNDVNVYWYDFVVGEEIQVTANKAHKEQPAVFADIILCEKEPCPQPFLIVWTDERNDNKDIYMYDFTTKQETQITTDPADQEQPAIFNNKIVWSDSRNGNPDIYLYDLFSKEEIQLTKDLTDQVMPSIYGDKIVWQDYRNGNSDIYMYDITTKKETQITTNKDFQFSPVIYQDKIVWEDERNGNSDIYMYDLITKEEMQVTTDTGYQGSPVISGNKIMWIDDKDKGTTLFVPIVIYDIYMTTIC